MTAQEFIDRHNITMDARPADRNPNMDDMPEGSAHWVVTIHGPGGSLEIPYSMGPGHRRWLKSGGRGKYIGVHRSWCIHSKTNMEHYPEFRGQKPGGPAHKPYFGGCSVDAAAYFDAFTEPTPPDLPGVLECLASDWSGLEGQSFEDWASDLGYDTDSRKAERIYRTILEQSNRGRGVFGAAYDELADIEW